MVRNGAVLFVGIGLPSAAANLARRTHAPDTVLTSIHPGVTVEAVVAATGWPLKVAGSLETTKEPTTAELTTLRDLQERTAQAHATA